MKILNKMEFINHKEVLGKWKNIGSYQSVNNINLNQLQQSKGNFKEIYFLPNGQGYWIFEGWTKGFIVLHYGGDEPLLTYKYQIKDIYDKKILLIFIDDDVEVFEQIDNKVYDLKEIGRFDNTNIKFIDDKDVLGKWKSVDFVSKKEDFNPKRTTNKLWLKYVVFLPNGKAQQQYMGDEIWQDKWTKNYLINMHRSTVAKYQIQNIFGKDYLFLEWKMGNYIYGGMQPEYYVFVRE